MVLFSIEFVAEKQRNIEIFIYLLLISLDDLGQVYPSPST